MFINCPYCRALVATDLATDLPPALCPQCQGPLREALATERASMATPVDANAPASEPERRTAVAIDDVPAIHTSSTEADTTTANAARQEAPQASAMHETPSPFDATTWRANDARNEDDANEDDADATNAAANAIEDAAEASTSSTLDEISTEQDENAETTSPATPVPNRAAMRRRVGQITPSFARTRAAEADIAPDARVWPAIAAIVALSALLALQWLLADRARLAADARWRPLLETLCGALRCDLPPWREPTAFVMLQRDVRQHPTIPGALRVSASFRNDARWTQPWPKLQLTLSDVNGRPAGERSFEAREYLGGPPAQPALASGETATVAMDILEPAAQIVAYDFTFM